MIVDSHLHLVDPDRFPFRPSGIGSDWYLTNPLTTEACVAAFDRAGVDAGVAVQGVGPYSDDWSCARDGADREPDRLAWVGSGSAVDDMADAGARGVRLFAVRERLADLPADRIFAAAKRRRLVLVATILPPDLEPLARLAERHPEVIVALDHCGFVRPGELGHLRALPHVHLKVTTLVLRDHPLAAWVDAVGPARVMWGSDYPQTHERSYEEAVELARAQSGDVPEYLGANALRLFGAIGQIGG